MTPYRDGITSIYWYTCPIGGVTPPDGATVLRAVTIMPEISDPVTVTRLIAESPPTFTVEQRRIPELGVMDVRGGIVSSLPDPPVISGTGVGVKEGMMVVAGTDVTVGTGEGVGECVGVGEDVGMGESVGVGDKDGVGESVGVGECVGVGSGVGDEVGTVVSGVAKTDTYADRLRELATEMFCTVRLTV